MAPIDPLAGLDWDAEFRCERPHCSNRAYVAVLLVPPCGHGDSALVMLCSWHHQTLPVVVAQCVECGLTSSAQRLVNQVTIL